MARLQGLPTNLRRSWPRPPSRQRLRTPRPRCRYGSPSRPRRVGMTALQQVAPPGGATHMCLLSRPRAPGRLLAGLGAQRISAADFGPARPMRCSRAWDGRRRASSYLLSSGVDCRSQIPTGLTGSGGRERSRAADPNRAFGPDRPSSQWGTPSVARPVSERNDLVDHQPQERIGILERHRVAAIWVGDQLLMRRGQSLEPLGGPARAARAARSRHPERRPAPRARRHRS